MSEQEHAVPTEDVDRVESSNEDLSQLTELARQAYHQKRTKNCLDLVKAILLIDPENAEAQLMRSSIRMEMHLDLENARTLLRDAHLKERPQVYSQAGSTVLRKILSIDPESEEAKTLLSEVERSAPAVSPPPVTPPEPPLPSVVEEQPVTAVSPTPVRLQDASPDQRWIPAVVVIISVALAIAGLLLLQAEDTASKEPFALAASAQPQKADETKSAVPFITNPAAEVVPAAPASEPVVAASPRENDNSGAPAVPPPDAPARPAPVVTSPGGKLAISSPTSVDIYLGDQHVGAAPITIDISPGTYTFEYRHDGMVKTATHVVNSNETTRAMISFDVPVQINARPWADVFIEGTEMKALGQTPMSNVRVPIGGILVFQNPKFPTKRYRVTGRESTIQIVFP
jgi:hypothetical protein